jgi:protein TonB
MQKGYYQTKEVKMKRKKHTSLRDGAAQRLQIGMIGALGIVIALFVFLGNVSWKPAKITGRAHEIIPIFDPLYPEPKIIEPPKVDNKVAEITKAENDEKADTIMPGINVDINNPIGDTRIKDSFENLPPPPIDAVKPQLIGDLDLEYPERMRAIEAEGLVIVGAALDTLGRVFDTRVLKSSGFAELDSAALKAIGRARFSPAMQHDKPLAVKISVPVRFSLRNI